jgi:CheY-like chemotaxis protein/plasmid maintenance system antidote protein VapI
MIKDVEESIAKELDVFLGKKLRDYRERVGWTLAELGERLHLSHQQVHKYERAESRISASMLYKLSQLFETAPKAFYEGFTPKFLMEQSNDNSGEISLSAKRKINILLIEDSSADEFLIRNALEKCGRDFTFYCLHNSDEVFNFLRRKLEISPFPRPDLILLDLNLPKISGISILKSLKQDHEFKDIPIIILTSSLRQEDMLSAYKNHASGFVVKAFDTDEFRKNILTTVNYWIEAVVLPSAA